MKLSFVFAIFLSLIPFDILRAMPESPGCAGCPNAGSCVQRTRALATRKPRKPWVPVSRPPSPERRVYSTWAEGQVLVDTVFGQQSSLRGADKRLANAMGEIFPRETDSQNLFAQIRNAVASARASLAQSQPPPEPPTLNFRIIQEVANPFARKSLEHALRARWTSPFTDMEPLIRYVLSFFGDAPNLPPDFDPIAVVLLRARATQFLGMNPPAPGTATDSSYRTMAKELLVTTHLWMPSEMPSDATPAVRAMWFILKKIEEQKIGNLLETSHEGLSGPSLASIREHLSQLDIFDLLRLVFRLRLDIQYSRNRSDLLERLPSLKTIRGQIYETIHPLAAPKIPAEVKEEVK